MLSTLRRVFSRREVRYILQPAFWAITITISVNDNFLELTKIDGSSMSPTLSPDFHETGAKDRIAWRKYQPTRNLRRGDVVNFGNPLQPEGNVVKRVVALEGDTVLLDPKRRPRTAGGECVEGLAWDTWMGKVVVPEGHVWVEGDNWRGTRDSNWYGPVSKSLITGKAIGLVWPLERFNTKPWEGYKSRTRVIKGMSMKKAAERDLSAIGKG